MEDLVGAGKAAAAACGRCPSQWNWDVEVFREISCSEVTCDKLTESHSAMINIALDLSATYGKLGGEIRRVEEK